jgi:hypothetical protein
MAIDEEFRHVPEQALPHRTELGLSGSRNPSSFIGMPLLQAYCAIKNNCEKPYLAFSHRTGGPFLPFLDRSLGSLPGRVV